MHESWGKLERAGLESTADADADWLLALLLVTDEALDDEDICEKEFWKYMITHLSDN